MISKNKHNSIVFLTTLSVYLGLVLIGAPPILAQAALTSRFEVKDKIEKSDDLDNQPDDEKVFADYAATLQDLFVLADQYIAKNQKQLGDRYEFDCLVNVGINSGKSGHTVKCSGGSGMFWGGFIAPLAKLNNSFSHTHAKEAEQVKINLVLSKDEISLKTVLNQDSPEQAERFYGSYDANLSRVEFRQTNAFKTNLYESTTLSFENNQIFIVTRLPRGSLDELLKNAKAEK